MLHIRKYCAEDHNWVVDQHGQHYRDHDGFDETFAPLVDRILTDFDAAQDPKACGWIAEYEGQRAASIFCTDGENNWAKLRLFLLTIELRGQGVGQEMFNTCIRFAKDNGYKGLRLWTHASHVAACRLYARNGLSCVASKTVHSFGQDLQEQTWQIEF